MGQDEIDKRAYWIIKNINRAIREYGMIKNGDRVAVAVSGGKDSMSLLRLLALRRQTTHEQYHIHAIHVVSDARGPETPVHAPLIDWLARSGFSYSVVPIQLAENEVMPMNCQRCTWNRRRVIFEEAERQGCQVVAFGHHSDDLAQTTLLNLLYYGKVETMAPARSFFDGKIRLVRPLCYTSESEIRRFARVCDFPPPPPDCPRSDRSRRRLVKEMIRSLSQQFPSARSNLLKAGLQGNLLWDESLKGDTHRGDSA